MTIFRVSGRVIDSQTGQGLAGLRVEAWDKDLIYNDLVGSTVTDSQGAFRFEFDSSYFQEVFLDRHPDLFFKIFHFSELIESTENSILWNLAAGDSQIVITTRITMDNDTISKRFGTLVDNPASEEPSLISFLRRFSLFKRERVGVQEREFIINGQRIKCSEFDGLDVAARGRTDENGQAILRISDYICDQWGFGEPINLVATPHSKTPVYLTTRTTLPEPPTDVIIEVLSWNPDGTPAAKIVFSFRCWVYVEFLIP